MTQSRAPASRPDLYRSVTERIIATIQTGAGKVEMPWYQPGLRAPQNAATCSYYRGINILALWAATLESGYSTNLWASYRQWQSLGAQVRKGERGSIIIFYKQLQKEETERSEEAESRLGMVARASRVFNAQQVDGFVVLEQRQPIEFEAIGTAEALVAATKATIHHGHPTACYRPSTDTIEMPDRGSFIGTSMSSPVQSYYGVLLHELTHWTGASHRLARDLSNRFGDQAYAMEELVAELGAAFLCSFLEIAPEPRPDHAAYIASWLEVLNRDNRAIFTAASRAQQAFDYLFALATANEQSLPPR